MKFFIVLFAVVAAASAGIIGHHEPIAPWVAPVAAVHAPVVHAPVVHAPVAHAPLPWVAPAPKYVKIGVPVVHDKQVIHAINIPQQPAIPPPHPSPLNIKADAHVTRIHYSAPHIGHPHLVGVEHYVQAPEPEISVVKTGHGHGWA